MKCVGVFNILFFVLISIANAYTAGNIKMLTGPPEGLDSILQTGPISYGPSETYTITLFANEYSMESSDNSYQTIRMNDFGLLSIPGKPELPSKIFAIALPPDAKVISVDVINKTDMPMDGNFNIKPALPPATDIALPDYETRAKQEYDRNYNETYLSDISYPQEQIIYEGAGNLSRWRYASVRFTPFSYNPVSKKLSLAQKAIIRIIYAKPTVTKLNPFNTFYDKVAKRFFVNYENAKKWYRIEKQSEKRGGRSYAYFILVPSTDYYNAIWNFALWKASIFAPDTVFIATTPWVTSNFPGRDIAEKIRNALIYYYGRGVNYALLVGEVWQIPMRYCYPNPSDHSWTSGYNPVPTDFYYADLTGNWDSDGDNYFGEYGQDAVDFAPEICVGRINWSDTSIVRSILNKSKTFEQNTGAWKKRALLLGNILNYQNQGSPPRPRTDCALTLEMIKDSCLIPNQWTYTRLYERAGISPSLYPSEDSISEGGTLAWWTSWQYGFVNWAAHGDIERAVRTIWVWDNGNYIPDQNELAQPDFITDNDIWSLNNNYPSIVYSNACLTGTPDTFYYCLGDWLLYNGAVAFIGGSRVTYYYPGWTQWYQGLNQSLNCYFVRWMTDGYSVGAALYASKMEYSICNYNTWADQHNLLVYNLWGDPSLYWPGNPGIQEENQNVSISSLVFSLSQCKPNPFNKQTMIKYSTPKETDVKLRIFNTTGRLIRTLVNEKQKPGIYNVIWNGQDLSHSKLPNGVYFCQLETDNSILSQKLTLLR